MKKVYYVNEIEKIVGGSDMKIYIWGTGRLVGKILGGGGKTDWYRTHRGFY